MTATTAKLTPAAIDSEIPNLRLKDIIKTLPKACFQKNMRKAWMMVITNLVMVSLGYLSIAIAPWYLLPLAWVFTGTALTGSFVIGHDCGHRSFAKRKWVNDLVGHLFLMPLIYPFHSWRIMHNKHHNNTNRMDVDNAWRPFRPEDFVTMPTIVKVAYRIMRGRLWWLASLIHWAGLHFRPSNFAPKERNQIKLSVAVVVAFAAIVFPTLLFTTGVWGFIKFWFVPWMVYQFWMSTFTLVHHTAPDIDFQEPDEWDAARAQLSGTVHCEYPAWIEFLCYHINVHVPHHISTAIPSYNLRMAHNSLRKTWGEYLYETTFSWSLLKTITDTCHLYHPEQFYQTFKQFDSQKSYSR